MTKAQMFTLEQIEAISPAAALAMRWGLASSTAERVALIEEAIDIISYGLTENRNHFHSFNEDQLTVQIIAGLGNFGILAEHDPQIGGHCDIVIRARKKFLWIAEAKIYSSYVNLADGFLQLSTRYSTGLPDQDHGEILIYYKGGDMVGMLDKWVEHMGTAHPEVNFEAKDASKLHRRSSHKHEGSGLPFNTRHKPILLRFEPQDKSGRTSGRGTKVPF